MLEREEQHKGAVHKNIFTVVFGTMPYELEVKQTYSSPRVVTSTMPSTHILRLPRDNRSRPCSPSAPSGGAFTACKTKIERNCMCVYVAKGKRVVCDVDHL